MRTKKFSQKPWVVFMTNPDQLKREERYWYRYIIGVGAFVLCILVVAWNVYQRDWPTVGLVVLIGVVMLMFLANSSKRYRKTKYGM